MKLDLDKYYTPIHIAKYCIEKTFDIIGVDNITKIIEPSAGNGSFSNLLPNCLAFDIQPEHPNITQQDFLNLDMSYSKNCLIIGNPPFGERNSKSLAFFKKAIQIGDYISFIQPISQLNNTLKMYHFDLIHSEDLGLLEFSDRTIHTCLNVYKRPTNGLNKQTILTSSKYFKFYDHRSSQYKDPNFKFDFEIVCRGGSSGRLASGQSNSLKFVVFDKTNVDYIKNKILNHYKNNNQRKFTSSKSIKRTDIYNLFLNDAFLENKYKHLNLF